MRHKCADLGAGISDLFIYLHGMLFTNIELDHFKDTLARFLERLEIEDVEEREWIMMGIINICAVLEYGKPAGIIRCVTGFPIIPRSPATSVASSTTSGPEENPASFTMSRCMATDDGV
jgi:protein SMG6